jgi:uncharacterized membrane protein YhaH (DUF805 family)
MTDAWRWLAPGPLQVVSLVGAGLWSVGLLVALSTVPAYQTMTASSTGSISTGSISTQGETLVGENGAWVLIVLAVPLAATLLVAVALLVRRRSTLWMACVITGVLALLNLPAMLTIGIFVLPVTGALVVACLCDVLGQRPTERAVELVDGA